MIFNKNIKQLGDLLRKREISARELAEGCLDRINTLDACIGAYISVCQEQALQMARQAQKMLDSGDAPPLCGIPIAIKDNIMTKGIRTTCASKMLENFVSPYDATVIEKLKANGAVIVGKTNLDEFAMGSSTETSFFKKTCNPWDAERTCGGSSGGSAAAVALGTVPAALGTDTGGSIRQPAAFCGTIGVKPTYGVVSRYGAVAYASSLDQIGVLASCVEDAAEVMDVISGYDTKDSTSADIIHPNYSESIGRDICGKKVGLPKEYLKGLNADMKKSVLNAAETLQKNGVEIVEISLPGIDKSLAAYYIIACAEASANLARFDGVKYGYRAKAESLEDMYVLSRSEGFGAEVQRRIMLGTFVLSSGYYDAYYNKALKLRTLIRGDFRKAFEYCDCILSPVTPTPAFKLGKPQVDPTEMYLNDIYTVSVNIAGLPAVSVPCGFIGGMPVSIQFIGKAFGESELFEMASGYESISGFKGIRPGMANGE